MTGRHAVLPAKCRGQLDQVHIAGPSSQQDNPPTRPTNQDTPTLTTPPVIATKENPFRQPNLHDAFPKSINDPNSPCTSEMPGWMRHFKPTLLQGCSEHKETYVDLTKDSPEMDEGIKTFMDLRQQQSAQVRSRLEQNTLARQDKQRRDFKKRHHHLEPTSTLKVGSLVLMKNPAAQRTKLHKGLACEGPYRLVDLFPNPNPHMGTLEDANNRRWSVSIKRLAAYPNTGVTLGAKRKLQGSPAARHDTTSNVS